MRKRSDSHYVFRTKKLFHRDDVVYDWLQVDMRPILVPRSSGRRCRVRLSYFKRIGLFVFTKLL